MGRPFFSGDGMDQEPKDSRIDKRFGLDISLEEALARFANATKEELDEVVPGDEAIVTVDDGTTEVVPFKGFQIRKVFHEAEWWFSAVDVIEALTASPNPRRYWSDLKRQMAEKEGFSQLYDSVVQLKMPGSDGKMYETDAINPETVFRVVQSIPSTRAEPFKRWLARVAYERIQEIQDPEIAIKRAIMQYQVQGRSLDWIEKRIRSIMVRKELTSEWKKRGVDETNEFALLTGILMARTFGVGVAEHRQIKSLKRNHNLRDHMTDLELIFTMLGEKSTKEIAQVQDAQGFEENKRVARAGGDIAGNARRSLEREIGRPVVSSANFLPPPEPKLPLKKPREGFFF
jgi:prophage antirepressor-like protein